MSKARAAALRAEVHQATADYIDAAIDVAAAELHAESLRLQRQLNKIESDINEINETLVNLNKASATEPDDKYALTKRKLVNLLDKLGIE